jgi:hypothetical protein
MPFQSIKYIHSKPLFNELLGDRIYFTKSRFSLNGGLFVYMELLSGHKKIITKSRISLNAGTLNRGFTVNSFT